LAAAALAAGLALPASGAPAGHPEAGAQAMRRAVRAHAGELRHRAGAVTVVADHLNNPRGLELAGGALFVAEAGRGGRTCPFPDTCAGLTSSITRVAHGHQRRVVTGLPSLAGPDGSFAVGVDDVSAAPGGGLFMIATSAGCQPPAGLQPGLRRQLGRLLRAGGGRKLVVADVSAFECAHDPDGRGPDTDPYAVLALSRRHQVVADAAGNSVLDVRDGVVSLLAVLPQSQGGRDPVPTSVVRGPDGAYYVGTLAEGAGNGGASVWRVVPGQAPQVYVSGLTAVVDLAFGPDHSLYVSELTTDLATFSPHGAVVRVRRNGQRTVLGAGSLFYPGGVAVDRKGRVYVSNWSILPASGAAAAAGFPADARGQVVRLRG
jgi:sugar lactone lactonase YvrE